MRCNECSGNMRTVSGNYPTKSKSLGKVVVPDVTYCKCETCESVLLDPDMARKVSDFKNRKEAQLIRQLPVGEFLTLNEASDILGITKQAFSKNNKIKRGFIYFVEIDKKKLFHKKSVESFKETGDGRFVLTKQNIESTTSFQTSYNARAFSKITSVIKGNCTADLYYSRQDGERVAING